MKKIFVLLTIMFSLVLADSLNITPNEQTINPSKNISQLSFRGVNLLLAEKDLFKVFQQKNLEKVDGKNGLVFYGKKDKFFDIPAIIVFRFFKGKLYKADATFNLDTSNDENYIDSYQTIREALVEKYGEPNSERHKEKSNQYMPEPMAIRTGDAYYYSEWILGNYRIYLELSGDNYQFKYFIEYSEKNLSDEVEKLNDNSKKDDL